MSPLRRKARLGLSAWVPWAWWEAIHQRDRPGELLEGEDLGRSLGWRLGVNELAVQQRARWEEAARRDRRVPAEDVVDLLRLVARRNDAADVALVAGRLVALRGFRRVRGIGPRRWRERRLARAFARWWGDMMPNGTVRWDGSGLIFEGDAPTAQADPRGILCVFYTTALERAARRAGWPAARASHRACAAGGASPRCQWRLELTALAASPDGSAARPAPED